MRHLVINVALWFAGVHTGCATFWNDLAEAFVTHKSISEIRKHREEGHD